MLYQIQVPRLAVPYEESRSNLPPHWIFENEFNNRIHNGHPASHNQHPHQVAMRIPVGNSAFVCGGSVLASHWVLTAAHCVENRSQVQLRFGSINFNSGGVSQVSFHMILHEQYNSFNLNNDIALIGIPSPLTLTLSVQAIRLPHREQMSHTFVGSTATVSGWGEAFPGSGVQSLLRWVNVRVISNAQCRLTFGPAVVVQHVICTLGLNNPNQGTCGGDSGGPLFVEENGINTLVGVVAFGAHPNIGGCSAGHPSGYMRTAHFLPWINQRSGIPIRG